MVQAYGRLWAQWNCGGRLGRIKVAEKRKEEEDKEKVEGREEENIICFLLNKLYKVEMKE